MSILQGGHAPYTEREARGYRVFNPGIQGPNVAAPASIQRIVVTQQLPDHPRSMLRPGVQGPNVGQITAIAQRLIQGQEQPFHPRSQFFIGPPPVRTQLPFIRPLITAQELPFHPRSTFHAGTPAVSYEDVQVFIIL